MRERVRHPIGGPRAREWGPRGSLLAAGPKRAPKEARRRRIGEGATHSAPAPKNAGLSACSVWLNRVSRRTKPRHYGYSWLVGRLLSAR
jgi:hypothetical protein